MVIVSKRPAHRSVLTAVCGASLVFSLMPLTAAAAGDGTSLTAQADELWNQPQGVRPDSAFYPIQAWWDGLTRATARDRKQRGLQELSQANGDLLNAYSMLQEQRSDPGPHPVAVIDPLLSGAYGLVTGVHVKAPIGSLFGWVNDSLVHLEGRGSADAIIKSLLLDYQAQRAAAGRDLAPAPGDAVWTANASRETAMLARIGVLARPSFNVPSLVAITAAQPASRSVPAPVAIAASKQPEARPNGKSTKGSGGVERDDHGNSKGHAPEKR